MQNFFESSLRFALVLSFLFSATARAQGVGPTPAPPTGVNPGFQFQPAVPADVTGTNFQEEYGRIVGGGEAVKAVDMGQFGDSVDMTTGKTEFAVTDVSLPGNNAIPVAFGRTRSIENHGGTYARILGDWDMDVPYMEGVFVKGQLLPGGQINPNTFPQGWIVDTPNTSQRQQRCAGPATFQQVAPPSYQLGAADGIDPKEFWQGIHLHAPGQGRQEVLWLPATDTNPKPTTGGPYRYVTSGRWYLACDGGLPSGQLGDGYVAHSPDGLIYRFNQMVTEDYAALSRPRVSDSGTNAFARQRIRLYPGSVEDRYGNVVTYTWSNGKLTSISSNDGRTLTFAYFGPNGEMSSVSDGSRTWTYGYQSYSPYSFLTSVTLPDASQWTLSFQNLNWGQVYYQDIPPSPGTNLGYDTALGCNWMRLLDYNQRSVTITHPSGATAGFVFDVKRFGRTRVAFNCNEVTGPTDKRGHFPDIPARFDAWSLTSKTVSGPGIASPYVWSYNYAFVVGSFEGQGCSQGCPPTKDNSVYAPDGSRSTSTYGIEWQKNDGHLLNIATYSSSNALMASTANTYVDDAVAAQGPYVGSLGQTPQWYMADSWQAERVRPLRTRTLTQDGTSFINNVTAFDVYARPATVIKSASPGASKTEVTTYENNTSKWVIGQVATVTVNGMQSSRTDYNADARPSSVWQFGKKQYDLTYHVNGASKGNVWQVIDGNNRSTTYTDYYRGVARRVDFADGRFQAAGVNPLGLVTSVTNEAGFTTNYGYYPHGRLQSIAYPSADSVTWNTRNFTFDKVNTVEFGLASGHWRQSITTGSGVTYNYFDALWRPVLTHTYDALNLSGSQRMVLTRYDFAGRTTYASYPQRSISSIYATPYGSTSSYDALGRLIGTQADSELGTLTSGVQYLPGFQKRVTNPRGFVTTTTFQVFDEPSESAPIAISEPEGVNTTISRDEFGLPSAMIRSGTYQGSMISATRRYVYDAHKRLCKTIEPESGATLVEYDNASNVTWRAAGQNLTNPFACDDQFVAANQKTSYDYDARNRITATNYGDGSPSISTSYTPDGLPWTISSDGSTWTYGYNKRRLLESEQLALAGGNYVIGHTFNANGHETSLSYPDGSSLAYAPNALGEPTQVGSYAYNITRHPNGAVANFTYGNGIVHTGTQTIRSLPDLSSDASFSANVLNDDYNWDANGNVSTIISSLNDRPTRTMQYDARDRLTRTTFDKQLGPAQVDFTYDPLDNLRTYVTPSRNFTHEYDASTWRLTRIRDPGNVTTYQYSYAGDAGNRGNVTTRFQAGSPANLTYHLTFDQGNRMRALTGSAAATYQYDGLGRRTIIESAGEGKRTQVYSQAGQLLFEAPCLPNSRLCNNRVATTLSYVYLGRHVIARIQRIVVSNVATPTYIHTDGLGSPVAETNNAGSVISNSRSLHEPYGLLAYGPTAQGIGYTGHVRDAATGLSYMQQRYYDPIAGRFLSVDPVSADPNSGGNFNRYWYANNNPYTNIDPDGRSCTGTHIDGLCETKSEPSNDFQSDGAKFGAVGVAQIKYNAAAPQTVPVDGDNKNALQCTADCIGNGELLVSGGAELSGHSSNSLHYSDLAVDIPGPPFNKTTQFTVMECARSCGYTHGWWEVKGSIYKDHWHLQIGPGSGVPAIPGIPIGSSYLPNVFEGGRTTYYYDRAADQQQLEILRSGK